MTPRERSIAKRVREWLSYAAEDFSTAEQLLAEGAPYPRVVGFHSQQAAEMYLKALLTWRQTEFPKTHDIRDLLNLLRSSDSALVENLREAAYLTRYAVTVRYPLGMTASTPAEADRAVVLARRVRDAVLAVLKDVP